MEFYAVEKTVLAAKSGQSMLTIHSFPDEAMRDDWVSRKPELVKNAFDGSSSVREAYAGRVGAGCASRTVGNNIVRHSVWKPEFLG